MTELDDIIPGEVQALIEQYGRDIIWQPYTKTWSKAENQTVTTPGTPRTIKGTPPASCIVTYSQTPGSQAIETVGMRFITTPTFLGTIVPKIHHDTVSINGTRYLVVRVDPIYTGVKIAAYRVFIIGTTAPPSE